MSDYEEDVMEPGVPTISFTFLGNDDDNSFLTLNQTVQLDKHENLDAHLPSILLKLRKILVHAGFGEDTLNQVMDPDRLRQLMPHTELEETFVDQKIDSRGEDFWKSLNAVSPENIIRLRVDKIDLNNFNVVYSRGRKNIQIPKSFFDDLLVTQTATGYEDVIEEGQ